MAKRLFCLAALLCASVFAFNGVVFGWGSTGGDGTNYRQLQETAVFHNYSGRDLSAGNVVILNTDSGAVTAGTTMGSYVKTPDGNDSVLVVGVVHESQITALSDSPIIIVTKGPVDTYIGDSSDAVSANTAVGTMADSVGCPGCAGGGTNLGIALEAGSGSNRDKVIVWVDPTGAD